MRSNKKRLSGNERLVADSFWCGLASFISIAFFGLESTLIQVLLTITAGLGLYFIFLFWSWHPDHLRSRFARLCVHVACWAWLLLLLGSLLFFAYGLRVLEDGTEKVGLIFLLMLLALWGFLVAKKYRKIMRKGEPQPKSYWSGNVRLVSDLSWCALISGLGIFWILYANNWPEGSAFAIQSAVPRGGLQLIYLFLCSVVGLYILFFFWSWKPSHLHSRTAKISVHVILLFWLVQAIYSVWNFTRGNARIPYQPAASWPLFAILAVLASLVAWKYTRLIRGRPRQLQA